MIELSTIDGRGARTVPVSLEVFPPSEPAARDRLVQGLSDLADLPFQFVSVTYGAGGTTRERTFDVVSRVLDCTPFEPAAHLTCVGASKQETDAVIRNYAASGVHRIVALRGDPPGGLDVPYEPHPEGYEATADLVAGISRIGDFDISVSAYPEKHPQAASFDEDLDRLAAKVDAGASRAITQFFFSNDVFLKYRDLARARGIDVPIVAGILPVMKVDQVRKFAGKCGAAFPDALATRFDGLDDDPAARAELGAEIAADQIADLVAEGVDGIHLYSLNRTRTVRAIFGALGMDDAAAAA